MSSAAPAANAVQFRWYLLGQACWYLGHGLNMVLYPWLVAVVLAETPEWVGITQMATMAPAIALMLFGGALADRRDLRRLLMGLQLIVMLPPLGLAAVIWSGQLSTLAVILTALVIGSVSAFVVPARDSLLSRIAPGSVQEAVTKANLTQFMSMLGGILLAGIASFAGPVALLVLHMLASLLALYAASRLLPAPPLDGHQQAGGLRPAAQSMLRSEAQLPALIAAVAIGIFFIGTFMVLLPLQVRDLHGGGAFQIALINTSFWSGTIVATFALLRIGGIRRTGRFYLATLSGGVIILCLLSLDIQFWLMALLCFIWGLGGGASMTMGRSIIQEMAEDRYRARVLAIYNLGFMGAGPLGALAMGYLVKYLGPQAAAFPPAAGMALTVLTLLFFSSMPRTELPSYKKRGKKA